MSKKLVTPEQELIEAVLGATNKPYRVTDINATLTEARTAAEQAVRDWLKRAECV